MAASITSACIFMRGYQRFSNVFSMNVIVKYCARVLLCITCSYKRDADDAHTTFGLAHSQETGMRKRSARLTWNNKGWEGNGAATETS